MEGKVDKKEFISVLQEQWWYSFEESGFDFTGSLPRGIQSIIEWMLFSGVYKMKGIIVYKEWCYPELKGGAVNTVKLKEEVKTEEKVKTKASMSDWEAIEVNTKIAQLEKEVVERKENWNKIHKQMEIDDMEYLALEKKYKELQKWLSDIDSQESSVQRYEDKKWMTIGELKIGYIELVNMLKSVESENKTIKDKFDVELKKQVGEIMKKNEYLQEDIAKMEREVFDYKQEPIKARKYFYKFKVAYDMMIEAGAKDPDRKAVEKEVSKFEDEKIKQQIDSWS